MKKLILKTLKIFSKKHKCKFKSDGGKCIKCNKTVAELLNEEEKKYERKNNITSS